MVDELNENEIIVINPFGSPDEAILNEAKWRGPAYVEAFFVQVNRQRKAWGHQPLTRTKPTEREDGK